MRDTVMEAPPGILRGEVSTGAMSFSGHLGPPVFHQGVDIELGAISTDCRRACHKGFEEVVESLGFKEVSAVCRSATHRSPEGVGKPHDSGFRSAPSRLLESLLEVIQRKKKRESMDIIALDFWRGPSKFAPDSRRY